MFDQMEKGLGSVSSEESKSTTTTADMSSSAGSEAQPMRKTCSDCGTYKTPLWRGGPAGPKSLCNACGIRSRKRRRALLGLSKPEEKRSKKTVTEFSGNGADGEMKLKGLTWQISTVEKYRKKLGEEEQAAVLLMAMAYSSVLA